MSSKLYNDKYNPDHKLVKAAIRCGLHNVEFTWFSAMSIRGRSGWHMRCDELPYTRLLGTQDQIVKRLKAGRLIDGGKRFVLG